MLPKIGTTIICKIIRGIGMEGKSDVRPAMVCEHLDDDRVLVEVFGYRDFYLDMEEGNDTEVTRYVTSAWYSDELKMWRVR